MLFLSTSPVPVISHILSHILCADYMLTAPFLIIILHVGVVKTDTCNVAYHCAAHAGDEGVVDARRLPCLFCKNKKKKLETLLRFLFFFHVSHIDWHLK